MAYEYSQIIELFKMLTLRDKEILILEALEEEIARKDMHYRERYKVRSQINRKKEMLSDIRVKCLNILSGDSGQKELKLAVGWKLVQEGIKWLSYEKIDDQPEIEIIRNICEALIRSLLPHDEGPVLLLQILLAGSHRATDLRRRDGDNF